MRNSRHFIRLAKSKGARALAALAVTLLVIEPYAYALNQIVSKYPTGSPTIGSVDMDPGAGVNTLYYGSVFGFNSAKDMTQTTNYAEIGEGACVPEGTSYAFDAGMDGWVGTPVANLSYMYDASIGLGSIKAVNAKRNASIAFTWEKKFFYDCGRPSAVGFSMQYTQGVWNAPHATNAKNFQVQLFKPSDITFSSPIPLVGLTNITAASLAAGTINSAWSTATDLDEIGTYTLRISGTLSTSTTTGSKLEVAFDNITLTKTPQAAYTSFKHDVEITSSAVPPSATNSYTLEIRAIKASAGAENVQVWVYDGTSPDTGQGVGWVQRATINNIAHLDTTWAPQNSYDPDYSIALSAAEYNNGTVRVRYIDATPTSDGAQDTLSLDYQRVKVDQGVCVDQVTDSASDCGKCHNYGDDITKPWPNVGMHNKHAQTESISDCLWCHPNNGTDSAHRDGTVVIDGTIVSASATPANGGVASSYNPATKVCSNIYCHDPNTIGQSSPAWDSVYGTNIERNCSRCHNGGTPAADNAGDLNIASAWPGGASDPGSGHSKHDTAFNLDETSCQASGSCHPNNISQHSVVGDGKVEVAMASAYASPNKIPKYIPDTVNGTGTCANMACHGGQQTPRFNLASTNPIDVPTQCTKCHNAEQGNGWGTSAGNASQWNSPISGLHRGSPPTSGKSHIADYGCTQCHKEPAQHFTTGGVSNLTDTPMDALTPTDFQTGLNVTVGSGGTRPNWTTPTTCLTTPGLTGGNPVGPCHAEGDSAVRNPATSWARRWSWDAYDTVTPVNQCKNCHGHWGSFNAGVVEPHVYTNANATLRQNLIDNHQDVGNDCATLCHGQTDTSPYVDGPSPTQSGYNHGVAMTASAKTIDINNNITRNDYGTTVGCDNCHTNQNNVVDNVAGSGTGHGFNEATWLKLNRPNGPAAGGCIACHGDTAMITSATGSVTGGNGNFDTVGAHRHHGGGAARNGAVTDDTCTVCHANTSQNMGESSATLDKIQLKNADTGATLVWDQTALSNSVVVTFCTACHDGDGALNTGLNGAMDPFGDAQAPPNIADKYNSIITAKTHNYTFNTTPQLTKARSPHGKPGTNDMKQATEQSTYTDANPVGCQSCHPSHGGTALNPLPAISGGADLTTIGGRMMKAGYSEPGSCWTCHNSAGVKDYYGDVLGGGANWVGTQNSAFTYKQRNYWSRHQVQATAFSTTSAQARTTQDTTANISCSICHDPHGAASWNGTSGSVSYYAFSLRGTWMTSPYIEDRAGQRNGTQTSALYTNTTGAPNNVMSGAGPREESTAAYTKPSVYGNGYDAASGGTGHNGYYIDENTFGSTGSTYGTFNSGTGRTGVVPTYMSETDTQFAGLCANCHAATVSSSSGGTLANMQTYLEANGATDWAGGKIHQTVKGWAVPADVTDKVNNNATDQYYRMHVIASTNGASVRGIRSVGSYSPRNAFNWGVAANEATSKQKYHEFSCSKCHTPHASSLGRLMITNCLDVGTGTTSRAAKTAANNPGGTQRYAFTYPTISTGTWTGGTGPNTSGSQAAMHCHNQKKTNISAGGGWNKVTGW